MGGKSNKSKSGTLKEAVSELLKKELKVEGRLIEARWSGKGQQGRNMVAAELES